jgi:hypothetical protein
MSDLILTKEYIESLGYQVEEVAHRIFLIKNFLSIQEVDKLVGYGKNATQEDWEGHYIEGARAIAKLKFGTEDIEDLIERGLFEITDNWVDKSYKIPDEQLIISITKRAQELFDFDTSLRFNGCATLQRQYEGVPLVEHVDNHTDNSLEYAAVFYLNNDYTGGEVFFVHKNIKLRPEPGSLLVFPASDDWMHGVTEVGPGPHRYVIASFISKKNFWIMHEQNNYNMSKTLSEERIENVQKCY